MTKRKKSKKRHNAAALDGGRKTATNGDKGRPQKQAQEEKKGMVAYFYIERGQVRRINLSPTEYNEESKKHRLYNTREEARRAKSRIQTNV